MSAVIDCVEYTGTGKIKQRWLLVHHPAALMAEAEFSWTTALDEATRFEDATAEELKGQRERLPFLPTTPPIPPMQLRVVFGHYVEPVLPAVRPVPEAVEQRQARQRDRVAQVEASIPTRTVSAADAHARWERDHDS